MEKLELCRQIKTQTKDIVSQATDKIKPLTDYASLARTRTWKQRWDPVTRSLKEEVVITGKIWSDAIEQSLQENNAVLIPKMQDIIYLDRPIIVESGSCIVVHPETEIAIIHGEEEKCVLRNRNIVSGQTGPVSMGQNADSDILIKGGIWSDQKNNGRGRQGLKRNQKDLMFGSQGTIVLSNVKNVALRDVTFRDCSSFAVQIGNAENFITENIHLDDTADGIHVEGPARFGIIRKINGHHVHDDIVALNAWDWDSSSLTFGAITDMLVEDVDVKQGVRAVRLFPGNKKFEDGRGLECPVRRCILREISNCDTFKLYDQPNIFKPKLDYSDPIGMMEDVYFEDIYAGARIKKDSAEKDRMAIFEIGANVRNIHFENIHVTLKTGDEFQSSCLLTVGPKSRVSKRRGHEIFNPEANPVAEDIFLSNIHVRTTEAENYKLEKKPEQLVKATSIVGGGCGVIRKIHCNDLMQKR